jgi:hypothetical protein
MADEKFSIVKFFSSFTQWLPWVKTLRYAIGIAIVLGVVFFVYLKFKPQNQTTTFSGAVGKVNIIQNTKKLFIPFVEGGVEKNNNTNYETFIRAGLRFEF